jgi:type VI secretion system secreted protein VgrG
MQKSLSFAAGLGLITLLYSPGASAQTAPSFGSAESYAVLAGSTVTNTGPSVITGNLGVSPGSAVTGFPPGNVSGGTIHRGDASSLAAQTSNTAVYGVLAGQSCPAANNLTGQGLGGLTLPPGVYCYPGTSAGLTGTLTLNAAGNFNSVFIFQIGTTLTTASNSSVSVINGGNRCNVFWQVGSSATLGTTTSFAGNLLALASITLNTGATINNGRALAQTGAVTLDSNQVNLATCPGQPSGEAPTPVPTLSQWAFIMLAALLALGGAIALRMRTSA